AASRKNCYGTTFTTSPADGDDGRRPRSPDPEACWFASIVQHPQKARRPLQTPTPNTACATLAPSIAALTIPPAKPAPSPIGNRFAKPKARPVDRLRGIRTGPELRVSTPTNSPSGPAKPSILRSNSNNARAIVAVAWPGNNESSRAGRVPNG